MSNDIVNFSFKQIRTEQFAIFPENGNCAEKLALNTELNFGLDKEKRIIQVRVKINFENNGLPFILLIVACFFEIVPESYANFIVNEDGKTVIPCGLAKHFCVLAVGTTRGILHTKTENTEYNKFLLPTINVNSMVQEDLVF